MNKAIHKLTFLLSLTALLTACSQDDAPVTLDSYPDTPQITVTRSTASGDAEVKTIFQNGTEVGLSVQGSSAYSNMKYEYRDGTLKPKGEKIFWNTGSLTVNAYYPYRNDGNYTNPPVYEDQSTEANYYLSDALHATGTVNNTGNSMSLDFKHRTAKIILNFPADVKDVKILNQPLTTGGATSNTISAYRRSGSQWKACIIPGTKAMTVTFNRENWPALKVNLPSRNYEAGKQYIYSVSLDNIVIPLNLSNGNITITDSHKYLITQSGTQTTGNHISIANANPTVTLKNLNVKSSVALHIGAGSPTIILEGTNTLESTDFGIAGINLAHNAEGTLYIQGNGSLTAKGATCGAGIGTKESRSSYSIEIHDCTITAIAGNANGKANETAAGIGSRGGAGCGNINIVKATVTAKGGDAKWSGAGIGSGGSGKCANIVIQLKPGQSKDQFLKNITAGTGGDGTADKIGKGVGGTCGNISWLNSSGSPI